MERMSGLALAASGRVNKWVERLCVALVVLLVVDVWVGVLARYALPWDLTFTEELARYLMIWVALLAVSSGVARRQHIGVTLIFDLFPRIGRKAVAVCFDLISIGFFGVMLIYGIGFVEDGFNRITMIADIPKAYPFMIVPLAGGLTCLQLLLMAVHDVFAVDADVAADRAEV